MLPVFRPLNDRAVADRLVRARRLDHRRGSVPRRRASGSRSRQIGNAAGYVTAAQYVAMLVVGLFGASVFDRWRPTAP